MVEPNFVIATTMILIILGALNIVVQLLVARSPSEPKVPSGNEASTESIVIRSTTMNVKIDGDQGIVNITNSATGESVSISDVNKRGLKLRIFSLTIDLIFTALISLVATSGVYVVLVHPHVVNTIDQMVHSAIVFLLTLGIYYFIFVSILDRTPGTMISRVIIRRTMRKSHAKKS